MAAWLGFATAAAVAAVAAGHGKKNVLLMISDDLRPELSMYGQQQARTPHLQAFSERALRFDRAFCQIAVCAPSRMALLSGRRPDTTQVWNFIDWFRNETAGANTWKSMPEYFKSHGYTSLGMGKTFHGCFDWVPPWNTHNQSVLELGYCDLSRSWSEGVLPYLPFQLEHCPGGAQFCRVEDETTIFDHNLTQHAVSALRMASSLASPFFMAVGFKKPHAPWGTPSRFFDQWNASTLPVAEHNVASAGVPDVALIHDFPVVVSNGSSFPWQPRSPLPRAIAQQLRQAYYAAVSFIDEQVGKVLAALDDNDLASNTVVVFCADHGYHLGEHGEWEKKANFEMTTRVPLLIAAPHLPASHGKSTLGLVDLVDVFPTLVDLAGLPPPTNEPFLAQDGISARPLFDGHAPVAGAAADAAGAGRGDAVAVARQQTQARTRMQSFSQYPRCDGAGPSVEQGSCNTTPKQQFKFMGYTVRTALYRYTAWMHWNTTKLAADWHRAPYAEELYDHAKDVGTDFDAFENVNLVAPGAKRSAGVQAARNELLATLAKQFPGSPNAQVGSAAAPTVSEAAATPVVTWTTNPVGPNETAMMKTPAGGSFSNTTAAVVLCNGDGSSCEQVPLQQVWDRSAKFTVPAGRPTGMVWSVKASSSGQLATMGAAMELARLNEADPWSTACHDADAGDGSSPEASPLPASIGDPTACKPGVSVLRVFGRGLAWSSSGTCVNFTSSAAGLTTVRLTPTSAAARTARGGHSRPAAAAAAATEAVTLAAFASSCYTASFKLPAALATGDYLVEVKNTLQFATYAKVGATDPTQAVLAVTAAPTARLYGTAAASAGVAGLQALLNATVGKATPAQRLVVAMAAGEWAFGPLDTLIIPDGVHLRGAGAAATTLLWPTQTGAICTQRKAAWVKRGSGPNPSAALITTSVKTRRQTTRALGWGLSDLSVAVNGGFQQNDTKAYCPGISSCLEASCSQHTHTTGMDLRGLNVSVVAPTGGVDMKAGGVGMGAVIDLGRNGNSIQGSTVTAFGDCGSNVTPLISLSGNTTLVRNNVFHNGCTIYSMRSVVGMLWEGTTSHYYGHGGRGGNVIATFAPPFRAEYITFLNNTQTNNPVLPNASVVKNPPTNHRLEGLTLDGGGGAYTGGVASATATSVTISSNPYGKGTGAYISNYNLAGWEGAALVVLDGKGAGQWRRVVGSRGPRGAQRLWDVDTPWDVVPDSTSQVQISGLRGHILLDSNSWTTAYTVQLYGMCLEAVVANNVFDHTPFYIWGRNPHNWGYQPNWNVEVLGNVLPSSLGITTLTCDQKYNLCDEGVNNATGKVAFNGALNSVAVIRGNYLAHGSGIAVHGTSSDIVVEWNWVHIGMGSFLKDPVQIDTAHGDHLLVANNKHDS